MLEYVCVSVPQLQFANEQSDASWNSGSAKDLVFLVQVSCQVSEHGHIPSPNTSAHTLAHLLASAIFNPDIFTHTLRQWEYISPSLSPPV